MNNRQFMKGEVVRASVAMVYWDNSEDGLGGVKVIYMTVQPT